jgi:hypothetical protein
MPERTLTWRLFALFTTPERAEAIEGDLIEEHSTNNRLWFAFCVLRVTVALAAGSLRTAPLRIAALSLASLFLIVLVAAFIDMLVMTRNSLDWRIHALTLAFSFGCGMGLVRIAPQLAVSATCLVFMLINGLALMFGTYQVYVWAANLHAALDPVTQWQWTDIPYWYWRHNLLRDLIYPLSSTIAVTGPLLVGSIVRRQRDLARMQQALLK